MNGRARHAVAAGALLAVAIAPLLAAPLAAAAAPDSRARNRVYWYDEARAVAREIIERQYEPIDSVVVVRGRALRPVDPRPQPGESQQGEGGQVVTWISQDCYVTGPAQAPGTDPAAATKLLVPVCKGGNLRPGAARDGSIPVDDLEQKVRQRQSTQR